MADAYSIANVEAWLRGELPYLHDADEQDTDLILASLHPTSSLLRLFQLPGAIPERRDDIALAICDHLVDSLNPNYPSERHLDLSADEMSAFIRINLAAFTAGDERTGFGVDFDEIVLPYVAHGKSG